MADLKKIREEMLNDILEKRKNIPENILKKINLELDFLESTDGLNNKSNLETLYNIYKKRNGQVGHKNNINSIVCYALGLTDKKPEGELLPPRRSFARASFPDVDTDFADIKQDDIFNYLIYKYGRENGSRVGTHQFLNFKSCVTRVAKALDVADSFHKGKDDYITDNAKKVKEILLPFPKKGLMKVKDENGESHIIKNIKDAYDFCQDFRYYMDKYPLLNKYSREIEGTFSGFSQHASGFVLSNTCISDIAPMRKARGGKIATQFVGTELETLGLIKFDILGLATLSVIELALKYIKENYDIDIDIYNLKVDDQKTFQLYQSGRLAGVFQCEQSGMQQTMREIHVDKFEDIMAGIALYRPGPMDSIPEYCARKKGEKPISYFHKSIEPFVKPHLENTYGHIIFQEQIMQICNSLAGFTILDGYVIIKAIGKKKQDLMFKFETQFINGCAKNKVPNDVAKQYWDKVIVPFAGYGFNKCLSGDMCIKDKNKNIIYTIEELEKKKSNKDTIKVVLDSYKNGKIVEDELIDIFKTGEKDIYEIELSNGIILRCTLDHKFICSDFKEYTVKEILDNDYDIVFFE